MAIPDPQPTPDVTPQAVAQPKHRRRRRVLVLSIIILVLIAIAAGLLFWRKTTTTEPYQSMSTSQYNKSEQAKTMADAARKLEPVSRAIQLTGAADLMDGAGQYKESLNYYIEAQQVVDKYNLKKEAVLDYSEQIGDEYVKLGDTAKARTYYNQAVDFVKSQTGNPNQNVLVKKITDKRDKL